MQKNLWLVGFELSDPDDHIRYFLIIQHIAWSMLNISADVKCDIRISNADILALEKIPKQTLRIFILVFISTKKTLNRSALHSNKMKKLNI